MNNYISHGTPWKEHKYIRRERLSNGTYRYFYNTKKINSVNYVDRVTGKGVNPEPMIKGKQPTIHAGFYSTKNEGPRKRGAYVEGTNTEEYFSEYNQMQQARRKSMDTRRKKDLTKYKIRKAKNVVAKYLKQSLSSLLK